MLAWLSDWLKSILAVVLLAAVIDLIMPGKAFHRYTRLVLGLLILLAMLGPLLKLLKADPEVLLDRGVRSWEASSGAEAPAMPNLEDIQRKAEELRERQEREAALLAARGLEAAMLEALSRGGGLRAEAVQVGLAAGPDGEAEIASVTVTLAPAAGTEGAEPAAGAAEGSFRGPAGDPVEPVREVTVTMGADGGRPADEADGSAAERIDPAARPDSRTTPDGDERWRDAPEPAASAVRSILTSGWGVKPERIVVLAPAG